MRLGDLDALKEAFYNRKRTPDDMEYLRVPAELVYNFIDNAPTVCGNNPKWCESCVSKGKCASTRPQGDLISREALIKWIDDSVSQYGHTYSTDMLNMWGLFKDYLIDNAPTVPLPDFKDGYKQAIIDGKTNFSRPQGEWHYYNNSNVNGYIHDGCKCREEVFDYAYNFCPNCGADMRGEEND